MFTNLDCTGVWWRVHPGVVIGLGKVVGMLSVADVFTP